MPAISAGQHTLQATLLCQQHWQAQCLHILPLAALQLQPGTHVKLTQSDGLLVEAS